MNNKQIIFEDQARKGILAGITKLTKAVKSTLGPKGRNVLIGTNGAPIVTKDGVTVSKSIQLNDPVENIGAQAVIEAASKTADNAGDGTTTTAILTEAIYKEGMKYMAAGHNPISIKKGIDAAVELIVEELKNTSHPVTENEIRQVATVSANWDTEIGNLIADAMAKVTSEGVITLEESKTAETTLKVVEGMRFDRGYISPYFVNEDDTMKCVFENPYILLHERKLTNLNELLPLLQLVAKSSKPLLIIAEDVENEVLSSLVVNKLRGTLNVCAIKAPGFGERRKAFLDDIAIATNGKVVEADLNIKLEDFKLEDLGIAKKIIVTKNDVTIIEGNGDQEKINNRIEAIRSMMTECTSDFEADKYRERLAKLNGAVAIIQIGASTEPELIEKKMRIDDALAATRAATEEGISAGGSVALLKTYNILQQYINDNDMEDAISCGMQIVLKAIKAPLTCLCENAGIDSPMIINNVLESDKNMGYNIKTGRYENLIESGVIDPTKVSRLSLQNAASITGLLLSSECVIYEEVDKNKDDIIM